MLEFFILKPSINLALKNKENQKPLDVCKAEYKSFFEKVLAKKKKNSEMNNDIVIHNSSYPKQIPNKTNPAVTNKKCYFNINAFSDF